MFVFQAISSAVMKRKDCCFVTIEAKSDKLQICDNFGVTSKILKLFVHFVQYLFKQDSIF